MYFKKPTCRWVILAFACLFVLILTDPAIQAGESNLPGDRPGVIESSSPAAPQGVVAKATYYAERYNGRKTSSGEIYDSQKMTAAHPTLRLGTRVKVLNVANNRSVTVRINDRLRKRKYEIIDLSRAAAQELDFIRQGKIKVRILPVDE